MRRVLLTGSGTGFGFEVAMRLAEKGFDVIAAIEGLTLRAAALASGHVDAATFDAVVDPLAMVGDGYAGA